MISKRQGRDYKIQSNELMQVARVSNLFNGLQLKRFKKQRRISRSRVRDSQTIIWDPWKVIPNCPQETLQNRSLRVTVSALNLISPFQHQKSKNYFDQNHFVKLVNKEAQDDFSWRLVLQKLRDKNIMNWTSKPRRKNPNPAAFVFIFESTTPFTPAE